MAACAAASTAIKCRKPFFFSLVAALEASTSHAPRLLCCIRAAVGPRHKTKRYGFRCCCLCAVSMATYYILHWCCMYAAEHVCCMYAACMSHVACRMYAACMLRVICMLHVACCMLHVACMLRVARILHGMSYVCWQTACMSHVRCVCCVCGACVLHLCCLRAAYGMCVALLLLVISRLNPVAADVTHLALAALPLGATAVSQDNLDGSRSCGSACGRRQAHMVRADGPSVEVF